MEFGWRANDGPTLNAGLLLCDFFRGSGQVLLRNPIFFQVGSGPPAPTPLWIPAYSYIRICTAFCELLTLYDLLISSQSVDLALRL